jgi:hypothetical protein
LNSRHSIGWRTWVVSVAKAALVVVATRGMSQLHAQGVPSTQHISVATMSANQRALFNSSMQLADQRYDPAAHLLRTPTGRPDSPERQVRESAWYAQGLIIRGTPEDRTRAAAILDAVLAQQYLDPSTKWFGAFKRTPDEPLPKPNNVSHNPGVIGYDPNWREFIGTTFEVILIEYPDRITPELGKRMSESIDLAVEGELNDGHVPPSYSNIAMLFGALLDYSSIQHPELRPKADAWAESVYKLFTAHASFGEYNSPTYYAVDLFAATLWRSYGSTSRMRSMGEFMETTLWNDVSDFYSPLLHNIAGPWDRSYGMDMESYVAGMGIWIATVVDASQAPLPPITASTNHVADIYFAPGPIIMGAHMTPSARAKLSSFEGPHLVTRRIDDQRVATAWIGEHAIWGAEFTSKTLDTIPHKTQFFPVTVQWRMPSGRIGWIQLIESPKIDATADRNGVTIDAAGDVAFRIFAPGTKPANITGKLWDLPGLHVLIEADQKDVAFDDSTLEISYKGVSHIRMDFTDGAPAKHSP